MCGMGQAVWNDTKFGKLYGTFDVTVSVSLCSSEIKCMADLRPEACVRDGANRVVLVRQGRHADMWICRGRVMSVGAGSGGLVSDR